MATATTRIKAVCISTSGVRGLLQEDLEGIKNHARQGDFKYDVHQFFLGFPVNESCLHAVHPHSQVNQKYHLGIEHSRKAFHKFGSSNDV